MDEKTPVKQISIETIDDKQSIVNKPRAKIIKGKFICTNNKT
jgi:hypothetical protein